MGMKLQDDQKQSEVMTMWQNMSSLSLALSLWNDSASIFNLQAGSLSLSHILDTSEAAERRRAGWR